MSRENREISIKYLIDDEGNSLRTDRDKPSKYGVTARQLSGFLMQGTGLEDFAQLSLSTAADLHRHLWERYELDKFPSGLDYFIYDTGVVCGFDIAGRWLSDSIHTSISVNDYDRLADIVHYWTSSQTSVCIRSLEFARRRRHKAEPGWLTHQEGKTNRVTRVVRRALQLANPVEAVLVRAS